MAELVVGNGICAGTVFLLPEDSLLVGRTPACQLQIADPWISSVHARLERRGGQTWVVDLASSNGTFVDGDRVAESPLQPGCRVRFGRTEAEFREVQVPIPLTQLAGPATLFRPLEAGAGFPSSMDAAPKRPTTAPGTSPDGDALSTARRQVAVLNEIGRALVDAADLDSALEKILETVARAVRAERAALLVSDETGQMVPRAHLPKDAPPHVPRALVETAAKSRAGLVTLDAQQDLRFQGSNSIVAQGIRSSLCAPIWAERRILGMLVLDRKVVDPFTASELELATVVGYQSALAIERARFLERALSMEDQRKKLLRHFSPDIAQMILSEEQQANDPLEATLRDDVTVLFSDVKGFTGLTERLPPLDLAALLRDYFHQMTLSLFAEGGTLDKFIGDGLMAVFGAPVPMRDGALRAVRCAWDMLRRLEALNARLPQDRQIAIRIGINTGWVIAGNLGTPDRLEFTVLGDTVNTASRLESLAEAGCVFVGRTTMEFSRTHFDFAPLGMHRLKGRAAPVEVFRLLGPRKTP